MSRHPSWARGSSHGTSIGTSKGPDPFKADLEPLARITGVLQRGDEPMPLQRASGGCYRVPSVSTGGGSPLAAMELALALAPHSLCVGVEVLWELLHISPTGLLLRSNLILEPLEEATYEQPASSSTKRGSLPSPTISKGRPEWRFF
ncbi:hypothetical protein BHE74_00041269 [Ensete ventricosum]|nr:hypothetical protein BHE74_00041269 [Ensete ventricosum]